MDARLDPAKYAGLSEGDAHVIRNAGGRASDDAIRSLVISYKLLGTREWFVIHHTDCGMEFFTDEVMRDLLASSLETAALGAGRLPRRRDRARARPRAQLRRLAHDRRPGRRASSTTSGASATTRSSRAGSRSTATSTTFGPAASSRCPRRPGSALGSPRRPLRPGADAPPTMAAWRPRAAPGRPPTRNPVEDAAPSGAIVVAVWVNRPHGSARHAHPSNQGSLPPPGRPTLIVMRSRTLLCLLALAAALVAPTQAGASQLIARDAKGVQLRVNAKGEALLGYTAGGKRLSVLAWGAVNAVAPTRGGKQVAFKLDYAGGWGKYRKVLSAATFENVCGPYTGPPLPWLVTACTAPDGSHWALQSWQKGLPNLGLDAVAAAPGGVGAPPQPLDDASSRRSRSGRTGPTRKHFDHVFGRFTYLGQPVVSGRRPLNGPPHRPLRSQRLPRHLRLRVRARLEAREQLPGPHRGTGVFCYGSTGTTRTRDIPAVGRRPSGRGRATAPPCSARE